MSTSLRDAFASIGELFEQVRPHNRNALPASLSRTRRSLHAGGWPVEDIVCVGTMAVATRPGNFDGQTKLAYALAGRATKVAHDQCQAFLTSSEDPATS